MEIQDSPPDNTIRIAVTIHTQIRNQPLVSHMFLAFQIDTRQSLAASATAGKLAAPSVSSNSLVVEGVFLSKAKSNRPSSTPGLPRCVLQARIAIPSRFLRTTAAATIIARASDACGRHHVSRPLHAQLSRPFYPSSLASCHTPPKHCGSPEHEQHLLSRCPHSPQLTAPQSAVSKDTSPADDHQNKSKRPSSTVPPIPLHNMPLSPL